MKRALLLAVTAVLQLVGCSPLPPVPAEADVTSADLAGPLSSWADQSQVSASDQPGLLRAVGTSGHAPEADKQQVPSQHKREALPSLARLARQDVAHSQQKREASPSSGTNLSIVNPLKVLRRRVILEMMRRRMRKNQQQIRENSEILSKIGKRSTRTQFALTGQHARSDRITQQSRDQWVLS